jgi:hypothetical protein
MDEATPSGPDPAQESNPTSSETEAPSPIGLMPPYSLVLLLTAGLSLVVAAKGATAWHEARAAGGFPEEVRREVVFALVFTLSVGAALVLAWLGELAATVLRLAKGLGARRVLARLGLTLLPLAVFGIGHRIMNPWLFELGDQVRQMLGAP